MASTFIVLVFLPIIAFPSRVDTFAVLSSATFNSPCKFPTVTESAEEIVAIPSPFTVASPTTVVALSLDLTRFTSSELALFTKTSA